MTPEELAAIHEDRLQEMVKMMQAAEDKITYSATKALLNARKNPDKAASAVFWLAKKKEIASLIDTMNVRWANWVGTKDKGSILNSVRDGERFANGIFKDAGDFVRKKTLPYDSKTINAFLDDTLSIWYGATDSIGTKIDRLFKATQQDILREKEINLSLTADQIAERSPGTMASNLAQQLAAKAEDGQFITINGRDYNISSYAELLARTRTAEAQTIGTIRTVHEYGVDLVTWVASEDACEECSAKDGEIYSISGLDDEYDVLDESPPLHPRCSCKLAPYIRENRE